MKKLKYINLKEASSLYCLNEYNELIDAINELCHDCIKHFCIDSSISDTVSIINACIRRVNLFIQDEDNKIKFITFETDSKYSLVKYNEMVKIINEQIDIKEKEDYTILAKLKVAAAPFFTSEYINEVFSPSYDENVLQKMITNVNLLMNELLEYCNKYSLKVIVDLRGGSLADHINPEHIPITVEVKKIFKAQ
jgi:hypothetical protein